LPLEKSLTPELTGAGGPIGPQGTNIGHQNREAMANVGVRVERFVRQQHRIFLYFTAGFDKKLVARR
jgi:hypothetical protein